MASAGVPVSPSSSKRSRSRDSAFSVANSSLHTPAANSASSPAVSTNSLSIVPTSSPGTPVNGDYVAQDATPYPAFLRLSAADLNLTWARLEGASYERFREGQHSVGSDRPSRWARCTGEEYAVRNRYANVDPYQANRVHLEVPEGQFDYINASPIVLETTRSKTPITYIATQGPKADSWSHIWRMIWKENESTAVIIMLTPTHEAGREKCYAYYPESLDEPDKHINEHDEFEDGFVHNLHLVTLEHNEQARTEVREIDMTNDDFSESRKIWHLLFTGWPDFSVPAGADRAGMLKLVDISREKNGNNAANPRIVHCSAGIGRSGTFIALDWLMQELDEGTLDSIPPDEDPIWKVVERLRDQRAGMVQSKSQFLFLYDIMRERWRERWIKLHPSEARELGITSMDVNISEPALKRQKSMRDGQEGLDLSSDVSASASPDARARLEAELADADLEYEKGRT